KCPFYSLLGCYSNLRLKKRQKIGRESLLLGNLFVYQYNGNRDGTVSIALPHTTEELQARCKIDPETSSRYRNVELVRFDEKWLASPRRTLLCSTHRRIFCQCSALVFELLLGHIAR